MHAQLEKTCSACRVVKPLLDFHKDNSRPDKHHDKCKPCRSVFDKSYKRGAANPLLENKRSETIEEFNVQIAVMVAILGPGPKTLDDIGEFTGRTREHVRQIEYSALRKVRRRLEAQGIWDEAKAQFLFGGSL